MTPLAEFRSHAAGLQPSVRKTAGKPLMKHRRIAAILSIAALTGIAMTSAEATEPWPRCGYGPRITCVVDGDTFWKNATKYRLADADAPEAGDGAQCARERTLAENATDLLQKLMAAPGLRLERMGKDRYGRILVRVTTDQGDVAANIIATGLARTYRGYRDRQQWCRR